MTNAQMKPNRYARWHKARRHVAWIKAQLAAGHIVQVTTYTKATRYTAKHADMFVAKKDGVYVTHGKSLICLSGTDIRAFA